MIPRQYRLKRMKDFEILFKEGRFVGGELVTLKVWKIDPEKHPRRKYTRDDLFIGFVAGTKVSKKAVERNRLKRQMREAVRLLLKEEKMVSGFMVAVIAKPVMLGRSYADIERSMMDVFRRARLLR